MYKVMISIHRLCTDEATSSLLEDGYLTETGNCKSFWDASEERVLFKCKLTVSPTGCARDGKRGYRSGCSQVDYLASVL